METSKRKIEKKDYEMLMNKISVSTKINSERIGNVIGLVKESASKSFDMNYIELLDNIDDVISLASSITSNTHVAYDSLMKSLEENGQTASSDALLELIEMNLNSIDRIISIVEKAANNINKKENNEEKREIAK